MTARRQISLFSGRLIEIPNGDVVQFPTVDELPAGAAGQLAYLTDDDTFWWHNGTEWQQVGAGGGGGLRAVSAVFDGGESAPADGSKVYVRAPFAGTIVRAVMMANIAGNAVVDVWKEAFAGYPPTVANTITASAKPTLSGAASSEDTTLTGWSTSVSEGDVFGFNLDSADTLTWLQIQLWIDT